MALSETARLIASLELQDKFSKTASTFDRTVGGMERRVSTFSRIGGQVGQGLQSATTNLTRFGIAGVGLLTVAVTNGIQELERLESVSAQTNAVIESTGGVAGQTAAEVRNLAEKYEGLNALIDDKVIQSAENVLLTFTNVNEKAFEPALEAILNINQALGGGEEGLQNVTIQVGKALQDPIRGLTNLRRIGINFTKAQQDQIKKLVEANDLYGAQQVILEELGREFGGSFAAAGDTAAGKFAKVKDAVEDAQAALATAFLPLLEKVADKLGTFLSDPANIQRIEDFGGDLAAGFETVLDTVSRLDFKAIGDALTIAGTGAKAVFDAFTGLPPWIQTAVLTGWGLNKLTGGALTGIAGTLTKALVGGGFGGRGTTPLNPLFVQQVGAGGPGGIPGLPLVAGGSALLVALTAGTLAAIGLAFVASQNVPRDPFAHPGDVISPGRGFGPPALHGPRGDLPVNDAQLPSLTSEFKKSRATSDQLLNLQRQDASAVAARQERLRALLAPLPFGISALAAKEFTAKVTVNVPVNVSLSGTQVVQTFRRISGTSSVGGFIDTFG